MAGDGGRSNISEKDEDVGKLYRVRRDSGIIMYQTAHGEFTCNLRPPEEGGRRQGRVGTNHLCGVLPQDTSVGEVPGAGMPGGST